MSRVLVVTNDFPPRPGGIQTFVEQFARRLPDVVVYASRWKGWQAYDDAAPFPVVRENTSVLLPTPHVARRAAQIARAEGCDAVWFGAMAPLGLLAGGLRRRGGIEWAVASTHGHEAGWATLPGARQTLRRIARLMDVVTYLGPYTRSRLEPALGPYSSRLQQLPPGVDTEVFRPGCGGAEVRLRLGLADRPVVVCVSRLMPRKGQDMLVRAWPSVQRVVPDAALLLVGGGPYRSRLERLVGELGLTGNVVFTGSVPQEQLAAHYDAGDVFAMPCRTRLGGLDVEGLGIVYLEASACGLPVVVGRSGGAPDAALDSETGLVVDGEAVGEVADAVVRLLSDPDTAAAMGETGRAWVEREWQWDVLARRLTRLLEV